MRRLSHYLILTNLTYAHTPQTTTLNRTDEIISDVVPINIQITNHEHLKFHCFGLIICRHMI
jgi:hypothetical protein